MIVGFYISGTGLDTERLLEKMGVSNDFAVPFPNSNDSHILSKSPDANDGRRRRRNAQCLMFRGTRTVVIDYCRLLSLRGIRMKM